MTRTQRILERDDWTCQYCKGRNGRAVHADHIVPIALRRRHKGFDGDEWLVAACFIDNMKKGTYRYCPPSHAHLIDQLPGVMPWTVWEGA